MTGEFWADKMPAALDALVDPDRYENLMEVLEAALERYADLPAFTSDGITITYRELDEYSSDFASYLQHETNIREGDRIALQMPNLVQYPVCIFGALKAGLVIVNTNPLYTEREMEHQFNDAQVRGLVVLENICDKVERVLPQTNIETVIITRLYDMAGAMRRVFRNTAMRSKVSVADYNIPLSVPFTKVLSQGRRSPPIITKPLRDAVAVLQYTGGTTGLAKGAMLTQRNLVANMLQVRAVMEEVVEEGVTGRLVRPGDAEGLARAMEALILDPETRRRHGDEGRRRIVSRFGADRMVESTMRLYDEVLGGARP